MVKKYRKMRKQDKELFWELYQLAGFLLIRDISILEDDLKQSEFDRLRELLLDALSQPTHFSDEGIRIKRDLQWEEIRKNENE
jgi:hypothetical protein